MPLLLAALVFIGVVVTLVGAWWAFTSGWQVRERLTSTGSSIAVPGGVDLLREDPNSGTQVELLSKFVPFFDRLPRLVDQAGFPGRATEALLIILAFALVGAAVSAMRIGGLRAAFFGAVAGAIVPVFGLVFLRRRRTTKFEKQLPEALDMMARAIRAGNALPSAIQLVGEEMPDPSGSEFKRATEEIRLGIDPSEALERLRTRVALDELTFFCMAVKIQRSSGGNLAEVFDRLAEVIRERFKLLSYAKALSTEHRYSAVIVAMAPVALAGFFEFLMPGYYGPLLESEMGPTLLMVGAVLEVVGAFVIWRIAQIKV